MIYINDKKYDLTDKDLKEIDKYTNDKDQLVLEWSNDQFRTNPTKAKSPAGRFMSRSQLSDAPPTFPIPMEATVMDDKGNENRVVYATSVRKDETGNLKYEPKRKVMKNTLVTGNKELIFFLALHSPFVENGAEGERRKKRDKNYRGYVRVVREEQQAEEVLKKEELVDDVKRLIRKDMSFADLKDIAQSFGMSVASDTREVVLRYKMLEYIKKDPQKVNEYEMFESFMQKTKKFTKEDKAVADVQNLIDSKKIKFNNTSHTWHETNGDKLGEVIAKLRSNQANVAVDALKKAAEKSPDLRKKLADLNKESAKE